MAELPSYGEVKNVHTTSPSSVYDAPPSYDVITHTEKSSSTFDCDNNVIKRDIESESNEYVQGETSTTGLNDTTCVDIETCEQVETHSESEMHPQSSRNSETGCHTSTNNCHLEHTPCDIARELSSDIPREIGDILRNRLSDCEIAGSDARSRSRRYEKHKSYSPEIRNKRRNLRSRSPNTKHPSTLENHEHRPNASDSNVIDSSLDNNEKSFNLRDSESNCGHGVEVSSSTYNLQTCNDVSENPSLKTSNNEPQSPATPSGSKFKFTVTKVNSHKPTEKKLELNGNDKSNSHAHKNGKPGLDKTELKINIPENSTEDKSDTFDKDAVKGDGIILKFKGDYLDADMLYEWTLEKKSKYAAQIRNVKMTEQSKPPKPRDFVLLSCMVLFCCNLPFGIAALWLSLGINTKYEEGKFEVAKKYSKASLVLAIFGIIVTCAIVMSCLIAFWP